MSDRYHNVLRDLCVIGDGSPEYDDRLHRIEAYIEALRAQVAGQIKALVMCREAIRSIHSMDEMHWFIDRKLITAADLAAMKALAEAGGST